MSELETILRLIDLVISPLFLLIAVYVGWILAKRTEEKRLKAQEIRNELEKAYGTIYSIISKPEEMVPVDERSRELRVVIPEGEKKELDRILMSYPHMFTPKIVGLWRVKIRELGPFQLPELGSGVVEPLFGIPLEFKNLIIEEYAKRLEEYYEATGKGEMLKRLPKFARA